MTKSDHHSAFSKRKLSWPIKSRTATRRSTNWRRKKSGFPADRANSSRDKTILIPILFIASVFLVHHPVNHLGRKPRQLSANLCNYASNLIDSVRRFKFEIDRPAKFNFYPICSQPDCFNTVRGFQTVLSPIESLHSQFFDHHFCSRSKRTRPFPDQFHWQVAAFRRLPTANRLISNSSGPKKQGLWATILQPDHHSRRFQTHYTVLTELPVWKSVQRTRANRSELLQAKLSTKFKSRFKGLVKHHQLRNQLYDCLTILISPSTRTKPIDHVHHRHLVAAQTPKSVVRQSICSPATSRACTL